MNAWINVNNALPEPCKPIIAFSKSHHSTITQSGVCIAFMDAEGDWLEGEHWWLVENVTHWMPMLEPPL